jgi:hypothetical protein
MCFLTEYLNTPRHVDPRRQGLILAKLAEVPFYEAAATVVPEVLPTSRPALSRIRLS